MDRADGDGCVALMRCLEAGDLEGAAAHDTRRLKNLDCPSVSRLLAEHEQLESDWRAKGEIREANRLKRRCRALSVFRDHGLDVDRLLLPVRLPKGYEGKILLLTVSGGAADGRVLLRGGDEWHREILKSTREEVADLGLSSACVDPAGGAWVRFEADGSILIRGGSDEFGACDRYQAMDMIRWTYPDRLVRVNE